MKLVFSCYLGVNEEVMGWVGVDGEVVMVGERKE